MILPILPLGHFLAAVLSLALPRGRRGLLVLSLVADAILIALLYRAVATMGAARIILGGWDRTVGIEMRADWVSLSFCGLFLALAVSTTAYLWREKLRPYFFMLIHILFGSILALLFSHDLFNMYVILELLTLTSFLLVGYERTPAELWAALKYLIFSAVGMGIYLFGVAVVYAHTGTLNLTLIAARIPAESSPWVILAAALLVTGVGVKAGIFIFSGWLPSAHASASPPVSALLSGLVINMGFVVLLRFSSIFPIALPLLVLGALTGVLGAAYAIFTSDIKRLLAFSTLSQVGYLLIGLGAGATGGAVAYAVAHGLFKGLLFLSGGEAVQATGHRKISDLAWKDVPITARVGLLVGTSAIIGLPPLAGFAGKALIHGDIPVQVTIGIISLATATAFSRVVPLFRFTHPGKPDGTKLLSYSILALPILFFLPFMRAVSPAIAGYNFSSLSGIGEALSLIGGGYLLYRALSHTALHLPTRIFRIEEGTLIILAGFLFVSFLVWAGAF